MEEFDEKYTWQRLGYMSNVASDMMVKELKSHLLSSQLSIIQAIDEWAEKHANEYKGDGLNGRREDIYKMFSDDLRSFLNEAITKLK